MTYASSSKMTLDDVGVPLVASLASLQDSDRQTTNTHDQSEAMANKDAWFDQDDYDNDGFLTPPLPPSLTLDAVVPLHLMNSDDPMSKNHHQNKAQSNDTIASASIHRASKSTLDASHTRGHGHSKAAKSAQMRYSKNDDEEEEKEERIIVIKVEDIDPLEVSSPEPALASLQGIHCSQQMASSSVVALDSMHTSTQVASSSHISINDQISIPKRRGRPLSSNKANKTKAKGKEGDNEYTAPKARGRPPSTITDRPKKVLNYGKRTGGRPLSHKSTKGLLDTIAQRSSASHSHDVLEDNNESITPGSIQAGISSEANTLMQVDIAKNTISHEMRAELALDQVTPAQVQEVQQRRQEALEEETVQQEVQDVEEKEMQSAKEAKGLLPDFIFEPPDDSMFAELRAFLDQEDANSTVSSSEEDEDAEEITQQDYEKRRLRKLRANEAILSKLGLGALATSSPVTMLDFEEDEEDEEPTASPSVLRKKIYKPKTVVKVDAHGTTTSLPPANCTFEVSCVDVPVLRPRIRLQHIFYSDIPVLPSMPETMSEEEFEEVSLPPTPRPVKKIGQKRVYNDVRRGIGGEAIEGEGTTCHQCRRKTEDPKMRCRYHEKGRVCPLYWCRRCLDIRYAIEFDDESRVFQCPRCLGICNCSLCLHKAGLSKICSGLGGRLRNEEGNKIYPSVRHYLDAKVGRPVKTGPGGLLSGNWITVKSSDETSIGSSGIVSTKRKTREGMTTSQEPKTKKLKTKEVKTTKMQKQVKKGRKHEFAAISRSLLSPEEDSSRSRKIKLTFKAQATAEEEEERRQRRKHEKAVRSVNVPGGRGCRVQFAKPPVTIVTTRHRGRPPGSSVKKSIPQTIEAAHVWVKSKADAAPSSSSSDSELEEASTMWGKASSTQMEGEDSDDEMDHDLGEQDEEQEVDSETYSDMDDDDDGASQDRDIDEGSSSMQNTVDSPQAGHIEYSHHPELTMTEDFVNAPHSIFQVNGLLPFVEDTRAALLPPNGTELTGFLQHLMGAGMI